jgi:hypothetical protein
MEGKQVAMRNSFARGLGLFALALPAIGLFLPRAAAAQTVEASFKVVCIANPRASNITHHHACIASPPPLSFGDDVTLAVEHAPDMTFDDVTEPDPADLVLFLDGKALPGTRAMVGTSQTDEEDVTTTLLTYRLSHNVTTPEARANWKTVLTSAQAGERLTVSTGLENGAPAESSVQADFVILRSGRLILWFFLAVAGLVIFLLIALRTNALRDGEPQPPESTEKRAFSLARVQMAVWTALVLYAYLFIWILTGDYKATIPASIVGLMGISLGTFGVASAIDNSNLAKNKEKLKKKAADPKVSDEQIEELKARTVVVPASGHFFPDIATSAEGTSLHRLQFILWTAALAGIFVVTVWRTLAMPDFNAMLLGLMGLTSGTYAALKVPENKV